MNTNKRSEHREIMDDFDLQGKELKRTLQDLDKINKWLGGNKITLEGLETILKSTCYAQPVTIMDVGCGNGSMLAEIADYGRRRGIKMKLYGIDANPNTIQLAKENTQSYPEISYELLDIFSEEFSSGKVDIILCTLTLHHFSDFEIQKVLHNFVKSAQMGIVINDLHRTRIAYYLFMAFCAVFIDNEIAKKDGLTSILRSFKKEELKAFGKDLNVRDQKITWKWAFRYQWILLK